MQSKDKMAHGAQQDKQLVAVAEGKRRSDFYAALDKVSESDLKRWLTAFHDCIEKIRKKQQEAATDKRSDTCVKAAKHIQEILRKAKDSSDFKTMIGKDAQPAIRAPIPKLDREWGLPAAIAFAAVLRVLLELRKK